jgi:hypothetical protein
MEWGLGRRAIGAAAAARSGLMLLAGALALAGCTESSQPGDLAALPRGATVAFESIDGLPPGQFRQLVQDLNDEAQTRRLAVISRENPSVYRARGYLAAKVARNRTTISWVWDVFDRDEQRALRISGEETVKGRQRDAWTAADDAMLRRIAHSSMDQLAAFLTSPQVAPNMPEPSTEAQVALARPQDSSPEAAGIFRISSAQVDPAERAQASAAGGKR